MRCRATCLSLNQMKYVYNISSGMLLGHILSKEDITMNLGKVKVIIGIPISITANSLDQFLGRICHASSCCRLWHALFLDTKVEDHDLREIKVIVT